MNVMKKVFFLFVLGLITAFSAACQDTITRTNGMKIVCKVTRQDSSSVSYKISSNGQISNNALPRSEIASIKYGNFTYLNTIHPDQVSLGLGYGQPFGFYGGNLTIYPQRNIGLFLGAGYDLVGLGYNVGAKIRFVKAESNARVNFFLTGMYGYVTVIKVQNGDQYNKTFYGPTFGLGCDFRSGSSTKGYLTIALLFPVRGPEVQKYINDLKNHYNVDFKNGLIPVTLSVGYMFIIN